MLACCCDPPRAKLARSEPRATLRPPPRRPRSNPHPQRIASHHRCVGRLHRIVHRPGPSAPHQVPSSSSAVVHHHHRTHARTTKTPHPLITALWNASASAAQKKAPSAVAFPHSCVAARQSETNKRAIQVATETGSFASCSCSSQTKHYVLCRHLRRRRRPCIVLGRRTFPLPLTPFSTRTSIFVVLT